MSEYAYKMEGLDRDWIYLKTNRKVYFTELTPGTYYFKVKASKRSNPKTILTNSFNFQQRPNYTKYITNLSFSYTWKETVKKRHTISPLVINFVKVALHSNFLDNTNDLYLINSFTDHLATSTRYSFTYNEQNIKKEENFSYFRISGESSGNILRGFYNTVNSIQPNTFTKDANGRYTVFDVPYSQYLRVDADFRYYLNKNELNKLVFRIAAGPIRARETGSGRAPSDQSRARGQERRERRDHESPANAQHHDQRGRSFANAIDALWFAIETSVQTSR